MRRWIALPVVLISVAARGSSGGDDGDAVESAESTTTTTTDALAGGSSSDTTTPETTAAPTTATPTTVAPTTAAPTTVAPTTAAPTTTLPAPTGPECLIGNWVITQDEMNAFYDTLESQMDAPLAITVFGQTQLDLTADTYVYTANFDLTVEVAGTGGEGQSTGTVSGTYTADDGVIVTTLGSSSLNVIITVMGQTIDGSSMANGILNSAPINDAPNDCSGPTPVIMFQTADAGVRHPVTLTPA